MTAPDPPDGEGFLGRWSRRKAEAREPSEEPPVADDAPAPATEAEPETIDPADLPDLDSLDADSDFSVFMRDGVPASLRTMALRKLWRLNPTLANLDGLVDYGEDLTGSFQVVTKLKSAYEVGKGFLREEKATEEQPQTPPSRQLEAEPDPEPSPEPSAAVASTEADSPETSDETSDEVDEAPRRPLPRRG